MSPFRYVALLGAILLGLAACGGSAADTTTPTLPSLAGSTPDAQADGTTTTTAAVDPEDAMLEYAACMREHGVDIPDPGSEAGGSFAITLDGDGNFDAFEEAAAACDSILEDAFGEFELTPEQEAELRDQELEFARCMRENGIDWPDPDPSGGGVIEFGLGDDVDPDEINAAMEACGEVFGAAASVSATLGDGSGSTP